ncbi:unnamed protein product [Lepeophtheirus salmonis]|uniref:(salmon louse) hypothetical protein n=1 Tax=Lepeophtheirus salmonis TaxID=72036 RepID=A0A7R8D0A2_LEPSM|nr:unnamed protein product [Lepeophtheirus salmonis]CAF2981182.1 unnamed protein product [Lepeophtheirus salmonis]
MGKIEELYSEMQRTQCFKCLKFDHTKSKRPAVNKRKYVECETSHGIGATLSIIGMKERKKTEEDVLQEELENDDDKICAMPTPGKIIEENEVEIIIGSDEITN